MNKIPEVLRKYKDGEGMTWDEMAQGISATQEIRGNISRSQLNNWATGYALPDYYFAFFLYKNGTGWVSHLGLDLMKEYPSD